MKLNEKLETEKKGHVYKAILSECDGREYSISYPLEGYGVAIFTYNY